MEKLTDTERYDLSHGTGEYPLHDERCRKALKVIDDLTQKLAASEEETRRRILTETKQVSEWLADANTRMLAAEERGRGLEAKLNAATELVCRWSNFDFDCPDEYNEATNEEEADGWALEQLYEDTAKLFTQVLPEKIELAPEELAKIAELVANPPKPSEELKAAAKRYSEPRDWCDKIGDLIEQGNPIGRSGR